MALIYSGIECAICNRVISDDLLENDELIATTHFIGGSTHHLWRFSDAAMHKPCFLNWQHRSEFVQLYNDTIGKVTCGSGTYRMSADGEFIRVEN